MSKSQENNYERVKRFAIRIHESVLHHGLLAMDMAIKEDGMRTLI